MLFACAIIALIILLFSHWVYRWRNPKCNGALPPGSMGLPIIGETIQYFTPYAKDDVPQFLQKRVSRYGPIFRTSLVGQPVIVSTDPEVNYRVFQQEGNAFQCSYTESVFRIIGKQSLVVHHGEFHKYLKNLILKLVSPEALREKLIYEMDGNTQKCLSSWSKLGKIDAKDGTAELVFKLAAKKILDYEESKAQKKLRDSYKAFMDGFISFPLNIPGTAFHACLQGRKKAMKVIKNTFEMRRSCNDATKVFVDHLLKEVEKEDTFLNEEIAMDLVFLLLFASHETTSTAMTLAMRFLNDHPAVLAELKREHENILKMRETEDSGVSWKEYKSMIFTHMVINETVRLANIAPGIFRKVVKEVEIKGYTFPAGWTLMVCPSSVHLDPHRYNDPLEFNPWRWEGQELHAGSKSFMAFGGGTRLCVGADFAKLQMAIFLHYLVTKYTWTVIHGGETIRKPGLLFPSGLHIEISENE
ncbi:cytochrome P450 87A3-like [Coffea eugenioides]|uniref:cytochrome P450 87A3-like n=1 Tax=Coffea eugenioides TaxID=49369 RepID=UPI000F60A261|nr:cytochrome P450 87A3-like [Coffea eugenioides]